MSEVVHKKRPIHQIIHSRLLVTFFCFNASDNRCTCKSTSVVGTSNGPSMLVRPSSYVCNACCHVNAQLSKLGTFFTSMLKSLITKDSIIIDMYAYNLCIFIILKDTSR